jgi:hypothetical protein
VFASFWFLAVLYLLIALLALLPARLRPEEGFEPGPVTVCLAALGFALSWPRRAALRLLGRSA